MSLSKIVSWIFVLFMTTWFCKQAFPEAACANLGTQGVPETITGGGSQDCPAIQLGVGIPLLGQIKLIVLKGGTCPQSETRVDAHHATSPKDGFQALPNGTYAEYRRDVSCNTGSNVIIIGSGSCSYGSWEQVATYTNWNESPCPIGEPPRQ